jgi:hypothetical protein
LCVCVFYYLILVELMFVSIVIKRSCDSEKRKEC